jgi:RNA polymerase sigma-70 factor, ECF subfamily
MTSATLLADDELLLIARLRDGDESALTESYERYSDLVLTTARRIVIDRQAAEDIAQEVFFYLWRNAGNVNPSYGGLRPFLATVARRRAVDFVRQEEGRRRRQVRAASGWLTVGCEYVLPDFTDELVAQDTNARSRAALRGALGDLPEPELVAIELAYFRGQTLRQVAVSTNSPEGTAKSRVRRALRRLEHHLVAQAGAVGESAVGAWR